MNINVYSLLSHILLKVKLLSQEALDQRLRLIPCPLRDGGSPGVDCFDMIGIEQVSTALEELSCHLVVLYNHIDNESNTYLF